MSDTRNINTNNRNIHINTVPNKNKKENLNNNYANKKNSNYRLIEKQKIQNSLNKPTSVYNRRNERHEENISKTDNQKENKNKIKYPEIKSYFENNKFDRKNSNVINIIDGDTFKKKIKEEIIIEDKRKKTIEIPQPDIKIPNLNKDKNQLNNDLILNEKDYIIYNIDKNKKKIRDMLKYLEKLLLSVIMVNIN